MRSFSTQWVAWAIMTMSAMPVSARPPAQERGDLVGHRDGIAGHDLADEPSCSSSVSGAMFVSCSRYCAPLKVMPSMKLAWS